MGRVAWLVVLGLALVACDEDGSTPRIDGGDRDAGAPARVDASAPIPPQLDELACAGGTSGCAEGADAFLDGTCCALGDNLVDVGDGMAAEAVDLESDGELAVLCGGFGARINDVRQPEAAVLIGRAGERCQHAAFGPTVGADRIVYLSHHGDSWVTSPSLSTFRVVDGFERVEEVDRLEDAGVLFEGVRFHDDRLYVAAHDVGLQVYRPDADGVPGLVNTVPGLGNAWRVEVDAARAMAYVVDHDAGLIGLSLADPDAPSELWRVNTSAAPRDVAIADDRLYVAVGGFGVDVLDAPRPDAEAPTVLTRVETRGSAQAVHVEGDALAVAAWSHVAIYDRHTLRLLSTQKTRPRDEFEQDLGVTMRDGLVYVAEWEGLHIYRYREGWVAPDLWVDEELFDFDPTRADANAIVVRNLGPIALRVNDIRTEDPMRFALDRSNLVIPPGAADVFEVTFTPPLARRTTRLTLETDDPDERLAELLLVTQESDRLDVGDRVTEEFAFLDPSGARDLSALEGHVTVLSYFALF